MGNSPLVNYTRLSPNNSGKRRHAIDTVTIHCMACDLTVEQCGESFARKSRQASSNYGIGSDGRIGLYVNEAERSWCSSCPTNDQRAVTIEVANCGGKPDWPVSEAAYASLIRLLEDICRRNRIPRLLWRGDKSLVGQVDKQNMTVHRWFANKACPGDYLYNRHGEIAREVNKRLEGNDMTQEEVQALIDKTAQTLRREMAQAQKVYQTLEEVPQWGQGTVRTLLITGRLKGDGNGRLNLSHDMLRTLVIMERGEIRCE